MADDLVLRILNETDYDGYVIEDHLGFYNKTKCPNEAVGICFDRYKAFPDRVNDIKCYSIGTLGEYSDTPGKRVIREFDWNRGLKELIC